MQNFLSTSLLLLLASFCIFSYADVFVTMTGDDANDCSTVALACATITRAIDVANAADTVSIGAGNFPVDVPFSASKPLTIRGEGSVGSACSPTILSSSSSRLFLASSPANTLDFESITLSSDADLDGAIGRINGGSVTFGEVCFEGSGQNGGALFVENDASVNFLGGQFSDSFATGNGGAISFLSFTGTAVFAEVDFIDNYADGNGGAINVDATSTGFISFSECTFTDNSASGSGGAINCDALIEIDIDSSIFTSNSATLRGGAINSLGSITCDECTGSQNDGRFGGAIYSDGLSITGGHYTFNTAVEGGAFYITGSLSVSQNSISARTVLSRNSAPSGGGAIFFFEGSDLSLDGVIFQFNDAYNSQIDAYSNAGAIFLRGTTATTAILSEVSFLSNSGLDGGAIGFFGAGSLSISDSSFTDNEASGSGGALFQSVEDGQLMVSDTSFSRNTAMLNGGAIHSAAETTSDAAYALIGSTCTANEAGRFGGAIYLTGPFTIIGSSIDHNTADNGGGVYAAFEDGMQLNISDSSLTNNVATTSNEPVTGLYMDGGILGFSQSSSYSNDASAADVLITFSTAELSDSFNIDTAVLAEDGEVFASGGAFKILSLEGGSITASADSSNDVTHVSNTLAWESGRISGAIRLMPSATMVTTSNQPHIIGENSTFYSNGDSSFSTPTANCLQIENGGKFVVENGGSLALSDCVVTGNGRVQINGRFVADGSVTFFQPKVTFSGTSQFTFAPLRGDRTSFGEVKLGGVLRVIFDATIARTLTQEILEATSLMGTFDSVISESTLPSSAYDIDLEYSDSEVDFVFLRKDLATPMPSTSTTGTESTPMPAAVTTDEPEPTERLLNDSDFFGVNVIKSYQRLGFQVAFGCLGALVLILLITCLAIGIKHRRNKRTLTTLHQEGEGIEMMEED